MAKYIYSSPFADEINEFLKIREEAGFSKQSPKSILKKFDQFCINENITDTIFTKENALKWTSRIDGEAHTTHYARVNCSKQFLAFLFLKGYEVYVFRDVKFVGTDFQPYIYSYEETERYFKAVDSFTSNQNRRTALQYPVLFRILYCCGTRINETLGIRKKDVDLINGIIRLNETKNNKQRYIVVGDDLLELIREFAERSFYLLGEDGYIFCTSNGGRLNEKTIYAHHRTFLNTANIPYRGSGFGPRIHDWRHHMAVYSFKQLVDQGMDMYVALPILSTYLGHKTIFATEHYVRLTLQLFPYIDEKFRSKTERVFGGVFNENN